MKTVTQKEIPQKTLFILASGFAAAITINILFYWIQLFFFKNRFLSTLKQVIPHYEELLYNKGFVKNINADRLITLDDFKQNEFYRDEGKIAINWEHVFESQNIPQQLGDIKRINLDHIVQMNSFDKEIFTTKNGKITIDFDHLIHKNHLIQDSEKSRMIDLRQITTSPYIKELYIDLQTGLVNHFSKLGAVTKSYSESGFMLQDNTIIVADNCRAVFAPLYAMKKESILPLVPWKIKLLNKNFEDLVMFFSGSIILEDGYRSLSKSC